MTETNQQMTREQLADLSTLAAQLLCKAEANDDRDTAVMAYAVHRACSELEESRREFTAANATIHNLGLKVCELESRTVTVKLPDSFYPDGDIELPLVMNEYQVIEALVAAGCKPVAVCPRCKRELDLSVKHDGAHYCHSAAGIQVIEGEGQ